MRATIDFFKRAWVIHFIGIAAICALIWFIGPLIAVGGHVLLATEISRLLAILAVVVLWGLNNLRVQARSRQINSQMIDGLSNPETGEALSATSDAEEEVATLDEKFAEALRLLKNTRHAGKRGNQYLYELPWYVIIGPPGSGKTTALANSGLDFPLSGALGDTEIRGVGGTRNCDWFFTDEAVLLDTAGRYTTQDSHQSVDQTAWEGFLSLLKKTRPRRPINGVMVMMSLSDLIHFQEDERLQHARAIRQRIQELNDKLGVRLPVYMLFSKCDLMAGFNEFFADLGQEQRAQIWGETFAADDQGKGDQNIERFSESFDDLIQRLNQRVTSRLQAERDVHRRHLIFGFTRQMASLNTPLSAFLKAAFATDRYHTNTLLRGVYLTSSTQEGTPIDRVMGALAASFKLDRRSVPLYSGQGKSYFLKRLLKDVIFREAQLAGLDQNIERRRAWIQRGAYASVLGLTLTAASLWAISFTRNESALAKLDEHIHSYQTAAPLDPRLPADFEALSPQLNAAYAAQTIYDDDKPWSMGLGLYQGEKLGPAADSAYSRLLKNSFLPAIKARIEQRMRGRESFNPEILYQLLRVYLSLHQQAHFDPDIAKPWIKVDWDKRFARQPDTREQLLSHLDNLLATDFDPQKLDDALVEKTRRTLARKPIHQQIYARIKADASPDLAPDFMLSDALGPSGSGVFVSSAGDISRLSIPGLFTYAGYYRVFVKENLRLTKETIEQDWVLGARGDTARLDMTQLQRNLGKLYFSDYRKRWQDLISSLKIKKMDNVDAALAVLENVSAPHGPIRELLEAIEKNTSLTRLPSVAGAALEKAAANDATNTDPRIQKLLAASKTIDLQLVDPEKPESKLERDFERMNRMLRGNHDNPPAIDNLMSDLAELRELMLDIKNSPDSDAAAFAIAAQRSGKPNRDAISRLRRDSAGFPEPLKSWIADISAMNWRLVLAGARNHLNAIWQDEVYPVYDEGLRDRYPLAKKADKQAALTDFTRFFGPKGAVDLFFSEYLIPFINTRGRSWRLVETDNQSLRIPATALKQFQYAARVRDTYFDRDTGKLVLEFTLKPVYLDANVSKFSLDLDGQTSVYRHGPTRSTNLQWPGPANTGTVRLVFESLNGTQKTRIEEGPWAWFKLLDQSLAGSKNFADRLSVNFKVDALKSSYELQAKSIINPFSLRELKNFRCPTQL